MWSYSRQQVVLLLPRLQNGQRQETLATLSLFVCLSRGPGTLLLSMLSRYRLKTECTFLSLGQSLRQQRLIDIRQVAVTFVLS